MRTSSATNVGDGKDSEARQRKAIEGYAQASGAVIVDWFYDAAVNGADPIEVRPGFAELLARIADNGVRTIIVETANRFARDLMVQEVGYAMLRRLGVTLVAADSPSSFLDDGPTSNLIRQILGAVSEFDKAWLRPSHPNDFNHTFQWLAELTGKIGRASCRGRVEISVV